MSRFTSTGSGGRRLRAGLTGLLGIVPLVPVAIGAGLLSGASTQAAPGQVIRPFASAPPAVPAPTGRLGGRPGSTVAVVRLATILRSSPGGAPVAPQPLRTTFGSATVLLVRQVRPGWVGVISPLVGNGRLGWLPLNSVRLTRVNWTLEVSLRRRELTVLQGGKVRERYRIAIGRPSAPTPTGTFAVTDRLATGDPSGPYGCCIIALSALAPHAIQGWGGGNRIAIHSTPPDTYYSIGDAISHGCMHVTLPQGRWLMDHVPLGAPAIIRS